MLNKRVITAAGDTVDVPLKLHTAGDQLLDLYYLSDVSMSMEDDLKNLQTLGEQLVATMKNLTSKYVFNSVYMIYVIASPI